MSIERNRLKCLVCNCILESKYVHDFQQCKCPNKAFIDGGHEYARYGAVDLEKVVFLKDDE